MRQWSPQENEEGVPGDPAAIFNDTGRALLVIGEAPGAHEDEQGQCFVGESGAMLSKVYLGKSGLGEMADVWLTNAVRCRPPQGRSAGVKNFKACSLYLDADLAYLRARYEDITVLCVGSIAAQAVLGCLLTEAFKHQGRVHPTWNVPCFATYHPAFLFSRRSPSHLSAVLDHLGLVYSHLKGDTSMQLPDRALPPTRCALLPPLKRGAWVALDIETYGAVQGLPDQTQFQPSRSIAVDHVEPSQLVQTVALSWPVGAEIHSTTFDFQRAEERRVLRSWLHLMSLRGCTLLGMHTLFDLSYLLHCGDDLLAATLSPRRRPMRLWDLAFTSYLHSELRPERSLKSLAPLLRVTNYEMESEYDFKTQATRYKNSADPALHAYNAKDSASTLLAHLSLARSIREDYPNTAKLSPYCLNWYNDLLWTFLQLQLNGACMDAPSLRVLRDRHALRMFRLNEWSLSRYSAPMVGEGSGKFTESLFRDLASTLTEPLRELLTLTPAKQQIDTKKANAALLLKHAPKNHALYPALRALEWFRSSQKLVSSYLTPLLEGRGKTQGDKSSLLVEVPGTPGYGLVHPSYYLVPSATRGDEEGGTNQGRPSCKRPALQTCPAPILSRLRSRHPGGSLMAADESQMELRLAALLSGDRAMMEEYNKEKPDLHRRTCLAIFGADIERHHNYSTYRRASKSVNFLTLYGGGAETLHQTLLDDVGFDLPLDQCYDVLDRFRAAYPELAAWQESLVAQAQDTGYIELPLIGQSRLYMGSARTVAETYRPTIVNQPVQCCSVNVLLSAQSCIQRDLNRLHLKSLICLELHDALYLEIFPGEASAVRSLVVGWMSNPPYYKDLCARLGRRVPLQVDVKLKRNPVYETSHSRPEAERRGPRYAALGAGPPKPALRSA